MSVYSIVGLIIIGYLLTVIEIFVPGGIFGIIGTGLIITGVLGAGFAYGPGVAVPLGFGCLVAGVIIFAFWVNFFPRSWVGRKLNLAAQNAKDNGYVSQSAGLSDLVGVIGSALTDLRPAGMAMLDGRRVDVVSDGVFIEKGTQIVVASVDSNRVVVRAEEKEAKA